MASQEPLWFCHECHAEMRPLMRPDPVCASCNGSFVEQLGNAADDPREFGRVGLDDIGQNTIPQGLDTILLSLQTLMENGIRQQQPRPTAPASSRLTFQTRNGGATRIISFGGTTTLGGPENPHPQENGGPPNMSEFIPQGLGGEPGTPGTAMAHYLVALFGHHDPLAAFFSGGVGAGPENGRMGDYVINQEAWDQIVSQLMENSSARRPVPATNEIITNLQRDVVVKGSSYLEMDCAVCKEQFQSQTENPDEKIIVSLPCKHPFHQPCIIPWLKVSGTCPVCRYALVAQPEQLPSPTNDRPGTSSRPRPGIPADPSQSSPNAHGGVFQAFLGNFRGVDNDQLSTNGRPEGSGNTSPQHSRSNLDPSPRSSPSRRPSSQGDNFPGSWTEELD